MEQSPSAKKAIILGAGPAGLTAAHELLNRTDILPIIIEISDAIGGLSRTVLYNGNRLDIGGHRFFSKSQRVTDWWLKILPFQGQVAKDYKELGRSIAVSDNGPDPDQIDAVMLKRHRLSRIFFLKTLFEYPLTLSSTLINKLGISRLSLICMSYLCSALFPRKPEISLEDFFINRFGKTLYEIFFKYYTEKVWGVPCSQIKAEWGAQRIKGLSVRKTISHAFQKMLRHISQHVETSLIDEFMYPKYGPGHLWETVAQTIQAHGGSILQEHRVTGIELTGTKVSGVHVQNLQTRVTQFYGCDYLISSVPIQDIVNCMPQAPASVKRIADGLPYRGFITVGLLVSKLLLKNTTLIPTLHDCIPDNWIYIQDKEVQLGRLQIFNNWSPYMVSDTQNIWLGLEYFCNEGDELWQKDISEMIEFAVNELVQLGIINRNDVLDATTVKAPKAYPAYFGTYDQIVSVREYFNQFSNLFLIGRNGMHRYNNADHSMLTAMIAVDNIQANITDKTNIWQVNTEEMYHESR